MFQFFGTRIRISDACKDKNNFAIMFEKYLWWKLCLLSENFVNSLEQFKLSYILRNRLIMQGKND